MEWKVEWPAKKNEKGWPHKCAWGWGMGAKKYCSGLAHRSHNKFHRNPTLWARGARIGKSQCFFPARWTPNPVSSWVCCQNRECSPSAAGTGLTLIVPPGTAGQRNQSVADAGGPAVLDGATRAWLSGVVPLTSPYLPIHPHFPTLILLF